MQERTIFIIVACFVVIYLGYSAVLIISAAKSAPKKKDKYDERQIAAQGQAYKWAFFSMCVYYLLYVCICGAADLVWCDPFLGAFLGVILGVTVFAVICVMRDAYVAPDQSKTSVLVPINVICVSQGLIGVTHLIQGTVIENGVLSVDSLQLFGLLMGMIVDAAFLVKRRMERREEQE